MFGRAADAPAIPPASFPNHELPMDAFGLSPAGVMVSKSPETPIPATWPAYFAARFANWMPIFAAAHFRTLRRTLHRHAVQSDAAACGTGWVGLTAERLTRRGTHTHTYTGSSDTRTCTYRHPR